MFATRLALPLSAMLAALALAACSGRDDSALDIAVIGDPGDTFETGIRLATAGQLTRAATVEGLVAFDEQGRVVPALADRWIVTDDGQSYIFRLRDGEWHNGDDLTAQSAKSAIDRALKALRKTTLALDLTGIEEVRAMAGRVIEIRLSRPMPYLLQLLAQPELGLYHEKEGAGPMDMARNGDAALLTPIDPSKLGMPAVQDWQERIRQIGLRAMTGPEAVQRFNDGDVDMVLGGQIQDFPLTRNVGILRGTIQLDPVVGLFGLQVMKETGFLAAPANREALAMAIDRKALIDPFGVGGWDATTRIVTPSLDGDLGTIGERWSEQSLEERRAVALSRVRQWETARGNETGAAKANANGDPSGQQAQGKAPRLSIWLPDGEGSQILFDRLSADFAAIGVVLEREEEDASAADLMLVDDIARYPRATWFLNRLSCTARRGLCSEEADARVAEAVGAPTPQDRAALLSEAEAELTAANVYIPFGTPIRWSLVRGSVDGFETNGWGWHPLMPLAWLPK